MKEIEITIKENDKLFKVILSGEALEDIEDLSNKLGTKSVIESILYSIKIFSQGVKGVNSGNHTIELPNGKKATLKLSGQ